MPVRIPDHVRQLLEALRAAGYEACPVGGCVRDSLMGREPADWDICTAALPDQTRAVFAGRRLVDIGARHGTVAVVTDRGPVEITTYRTDGDYPDGRHPEHVAFVSSLEQDLARRDFTVNAMALAPDGEIVDPFGGRADLAAGVIRCVGEPERRFGEDALRILRALRFASKLDFIIEPATARSAERDRTLLDKVSRERVLAELMGLLAGPGAGRVLREHAKVIFAVIPELAVQEGFDQKNPNHIHDIWTHTTMAVDAIAPDPALRLTMLLHDVGKPACYFTDENGTGHFYGHAKKGAEMADAILRRLRSSGELRRQVVTFINWHDIEPPQTKKAMARLTAKLGEDTVRKLIACWRADSADRSAAVRERNLAVIARSEQALEEALREPERCFDLRSLAVDGRDILALGVPEGPAVGRVLTALFQQVLGGAVPNERRALLEKAAGYAAAEREKYAHIPAGPDGTVR